MTDQGPSSSQATCKCIASEFTYLALRSSPPPPRLCRYRSRGVLSGPLWLRATPTANHVSGRPARPGSGPASPGASGGLPRSSSVRSGHSVHRPRQYPAKQQISSTHIQSWHMTRITRYHIGSAPLAQLASSLNALFAFVQSSVWGTPKAFSVGYCLTIGRPALAPTIQGSQFPSSPLFARCSGCHTPTIHYARTYTDSLPHHLRGHGQRCL